MKLEEVKEWVREFGTFPPSDLSEKETGIWTDGYVHGLTDAMNYLIKKLGGRNESRTDK